MSLSPLTHRICIVRCLKTRLPLIQNLNNVFVLVTQTHSLGLVEVLLCVIVCIFISQCILAVVENVMLVKSRFPPSQEFIFNLCGTVVL